MDNIASDKSPQALQRIERAGGERALSATLRSELAPPDGEPYRRTSGRRSPVMST